MPAKPLDAQQLQEASELRSKFRAWQKVQREAQRPFSQSWAAAKIGIGQSAFNQYLSGVLPLNWRIVQKLGILLHVAPEELSPLSAKAVAASKLPATLNELPPGQSAPGLAHQLAAALANLRGMDLTLAAAAIAHLCESPRDKARVRAVQNYLDQISAD